MSVPTVSFEFFPPAEEAMAGQLWQAIQRLAPLQPSFVSVTYGADGSTRTRTHECVMRILRETTLRVAPHLTCVAASRAQVLGIAEQYWSAGVRHLVALRGDAPAGQLSAEGRYCPHPDGFPYASDLVQGLRQVGSFDVSVAAYPEGHPESGGVDADLENLKRKIDAGANRAITQFVFDTDFFLRYRDRCAAEGIRASIVPGILPITRFPQLLRMAQRCGASVPDWLHSRFDGLEDDPDTRRMIAANVAIEQVQRLRQHGVNEFHFYTLNRAELTYAICHALDLRPGVQEARVA
ncbi:MAG: methylenetetrahydrofolate reductase [NAD(P)H] [Pseudomonadota bacterium]|nr:methylenetetrahydrofolate reductase [NAD(P)H] [Pseudomonadota bacterium]